MPPLPYYEDDHVTIYHGDCLNIIDQLAFDVALLDPPYSMTPNAVRGRDDGAAGTSGAPMRLLCDTLDAVRRRMKPGGIAPLICDWRRVPDVSYLATRTGLRIATTVAWTRTTIGTGGLFRSAWDPVLVLSQGSPTAKDRAGVPNVITANPPHKRVHPYEKPPALWQHFTDRIAPGTVVDPFMGSGAGLVAAANGGHRYIGIEIEERYCEIAAKRMGQEVLAL